VNQDLALLIDLQGVDLQIRSHAQNVAQIKERMKASEQEVTDCQKELEYIKGLRDENQKQRRKAERRLEVKEGEVKKYKGQLLNVKTNREYQSLLHEIEKAQADSERIEEEIIELLEAADELEEKIKQAEAHFKEVQAQVAHQKQQMQAELEREQQECQRLQQERLQLKQGVAATLLTHYEKLIKTKDGVALAVARDGVCQGCFIRIPPQDYEELKKKERIYYCPSCFRILYVE